MRKSEKGLADRRAVHLADGEEGEEGLRGYVVSWLVVDGSTAAVAILLC